MQPAPVGRAAAKKIAYHARGGENGGHHDSHGLRSATRSQRHSSRLALPDGRELFAALRGTRSLRETFAKYIDFVSNGSHAYEVLFDGVGKPPSLQESWPSFNLMRDRLANVWRGFPATYASHACRWCLMHGTAMLVIRGGFEGALRTQPFTRVSMLSTAFSTRRRAQAPFLSGPKCLQPGSGRGQQSRAGNAMRETENKT